MDKRNINYNICKQNVPLQAFLFNWKETLYLLVDWNWRKKDTNNYIVDPCKTKHLKYFKNIIKTDKH